MRRTLMLDEDDLIMVVKEDIVKLIDKNRGEMNRTEFVNYLIQAQLKACENEHLYVTREEFLESSQEMMELLRNFLQFFVSYSMTMGKRRSGDDLETLKRQLESFETREPDEDTGASPL